MSLSPKNIINKYFPGLKNNSTLRRWYLMFLNRGPEFSVEYAWLKAKGDAVLRLSYALDESSVVFDLGGYEGQWAQDIFNKYRCTVHIFEPVPQFAEQIKKRFVGNHKIFVYDFGLAGATEAAKIGLADNGSSLFKSGGQELDIKLVRATDFFLENNINHIGLIKLNIEGAEYDVLEHLLETGWVKNISNLQIQFHPIPDSERRMETIQQGLAKTHSLTYQFPYVWENWRLKS